MIHDLRLVSFDLCPYVQRAAIVLAEKGVAYERIDIDLDARPAWFLPLSPHGRVPVLQVGSHALFESSAIVEYLDETHAPPLHPANPVERARHRAWMEAGSAVLADIWTLETTAEQAAFDDARRSLATRLARVSEALGEGPFFGGDRLCLVDAVFAPAFRYFDVFERFVDLGVFDGLPRLAAWRAALAERPSVRQAVAPSYPARLADFVRRRGGILARALDGAGAG